MSILSTLLPLRRKPRVVRVTLKKSKPEPIPAVGQGPGRMCTKCTLVWTQRSSGKCAQCDPPKEVV